MYIVGAVHEWVCQKKGTTKYKMFQCFKSSLCCAVWEFGGSIMVSISKLTLTIMLPPKTKNRNHRINSTVSVL